jgi:MFS family permease
MNITAYFYDPVKRNVSLIALCQAFSMTGNVVLFTVAALVGQSLAIEKALTTLPLAILQLATMLATIPASLLMQRIGRGRGFMVGILVGTGGALLGVAAIVSQSFWEFCGATMLLGISNGFAGYYRFAAAEVAAAGWQSQAISLVVSGGVISAIVGPQIANLSKDLLPASTFSGSFVAIAVIFVATLGILALVEFPEFSRSQVQGEGRPLGVIMRQPIFIVAVLGSMLGYGVMVLIMTATPLSIVADAHPFHHAASVLQLHVLGMFVPSFFTGGLIARFGTLRIITCGVLLSLLCIVINLLSSGLLSYSIALTFLGIGWNFLYIGSTSLLPQTYTPTEKAKTQAAHDFSMFGFVTIATVLSGGLFRTLGWAAVNWAGLPMMLIVLGAIVWLQKYHDYHDPVKS